MTEHYDALESRDPGQREAALLAALPAQVAHAKQNTDGFGRILADVDARAVSSRAALAALPVTRKSDLHELQRTTVPFGGLNATPAGQLARIFISPGPIYDPEGRGADWWRMARPLFAAGFRSGDVIQNCFSYHFTPAASMLEGGALKLGCAVIPAGTGQTEQQVAAMAGLKPAGYVGTPSFLKIILEKALELGADVTSLKKALVSAEALPPSLRQWLADHGVRALQTYASADLGNIAYETDAMQGLIVDEDIILEILRPGTGDPVAAGEVGEVVVTKLDRDYPLVRFATGDLSAILPGISPCGRTNMRIKGWMGRADQTTKVKGMFVHPGQVASVVKRHPEILKARLVVDNPGGADRMTLHCEVANAPAGLAAAVADSLRDVTKLRGEVSLRKPGELPNDGKVIEDAKKYD
ncbi:MAG: AMP-binding protein [Betaproteobacteria bacterium]